MNSQKYKPKSEPVSVFADIRGIRYRLLEWGERESPLLVFLHGWGDCAASFQFLVDELQEDWFVVAPDWRGFGQSYNRCNGYWFPDYIADLDVILTRYLDEQPANLFGHSMGANAAGLFAGIFPDRVRSFINVEGFGLADGDPAQAPENYRRWITRSRTMPAYATYREFDELAARILKRSPAMSHDKARFVAEQWAVRTDDGLIELRADPAHKLPNAVQYRRAEAEACWRKISAAMLLASGATSPFAEQFGGLESLPFPASRSCSIPGAGHMIHFEAPELLAAQIEAFLR